MDLAGAYPYHFALGSHGRRALDRLGGSITALATPFRADALDLEAFARLIDQQLAAGT